MSNNRLSYLLEQVQASAAAPEEYSELLNMIQQEPSEDTIDQITVFLQSRIPATSITTDDLWSSREETINEVIRVCHRIDLKKATESETFRIPVIRRRWFRYAAAAAIIIITSGVYFFNRKTNEKPAIANQKSIDPLPGSNKAILTLANGSKIILDSAVNGTLAHQGNTAIIKTDSGRLSYNSTKNEKEILYNTLTTPRGGQFQLTLPDGTKVWLNAASSITYPTAFIGKERKVRITGEVYFEVAHNKSKPFSVEANGTIISDIGTSFNVNAYGDDKLIKTTLIEGSVKITTTKQARVIKPDEQAITQVGSVTINIAKDVNLEKVMAWHNGKMMLSNVSVEQIMREISRWYDMDIVYAGKIPEKQFYGSVRRDAKLSTILNALRDYGVQTKIENRKIIVQ